MPENMNREFSYFDVADSLFAKTPIASSTSQFSEEHRNKEYPVENGKSAPFENNSDLSKVYMRVPLNS